MNYGMIKSFDIADGPGVRVSLFVSGCKNHCKGCFQPETWDFNYGDLFTDDTINSILTALSPNYIEGLTILGGDPFEIENQLEVLKLIKAVKSTYTNKNIWIYTGYIYDIDLINKGKRYIEGVTDEILRLADVLVDGPFIESQKDISLEFRGSKNQRILDLRALTKR